GAASTRERWLKLAAPAGLIALAWSLAQIAFALWPTIDTLTQRALHVSFAISLGFALLAMKGPAGWSRWVSYLLAALAMTPGIYISLNADYLMGGRIVGLDPVMPLDYLFGILMIALLFIVSYRLLGFGLTIFAATFIVYFFIGPYLPGALSHRYTGL